MIKYPDKNKVRKARHDRMRNQLKGTAARPRLNVYRSLKHVYAQVIDDGPGITLCSASTMDAQIKDEAAKKTKKEAARMVGELIGKRAKDKGITQVVFDRGGYLYTGRVQEIAEGARKAGLDF